VSSERVSSILKGAKSEPTMEKRWELWAWMLRSGVIGVGFCGIQGLIVCHAGWGTMDKGIRVRFVFWRLSRQNGPKNDYSKSCGGEAVPRHSLDAGAYKERMFFA
jgi:hypothetical protein